MTVVTAGGSPRLLVILLIDIALVPHHNPPAWILHCSLALNLGWRFFVSRNHF